MAWWGVLVSRSIAQAQRFRQLFTGRTNAYGLAKGGVVREALTNRMYLDHLNEIVGSAIGVFPLLDDGNVHFAAIDLDEPDFELAGRLAMRLPGPAWIEKSRSGNAHIWCFFETPAPAWLARAIMRFECESFQRSDVEIFPKQDALYPGMVGNYINLPLPEGPRPIIWRTGDGKVDSTGPGYTLDAFLEEALKERNLVRKWLGLARHRQLRPPAEAERGDVEWGQRSTPHLCAMYIIEHSTDNPPALGHRHTVMFNLTKMLYNTLMFDDEERWQILTNVNDKSQHPLPEAEIRRMINNVCRSQFTSTGCDDPVMAPYISPDCGIAHA